MQMQKVKKAPPVFNNCSVIIVYDAYKYKDYDYLINAKLKREDDGSGYGMGERDLEYCFKTKFGAVNFAKRAKRTLRKLKYLKRIFVYDSNGDRVAL